MTGTFKVFIGNLNGQLFILTFKITGKLVPIINLRLREWTVPLSTSISKGRISTVEQNKRL